MRRQFTGAERRQWIERLLERYASTVWSSVLRRHTDLVEAEDAFLQVFVVAITSLNRVRALHLTDAFIEECIQVVERTAIPHVMSEELVRYESDTDGDAVDESSPTTVRKADVPANFVAAPTEIPPYLLVRAIQMMRAHTAMNEALRIHRGPKWIRLGVTAIAVIGVAGVAYGATIDIQARPHAKPPVETKASSPQMSNYVGDLPVSVVASFRVPQAMMTAIDLQHTVVQNSNIYFGRLVQSSDNWPRIQVSAVPFSSQPASVLHASDVHPIELIPPKPQMVGGKSVNWSISSWRLYAMSSWLVAAVRWNNGEGPTSNMVQIYLMNTALDKASLVRTFAPEPGLANEFVVAAGNGQIMVQKALNVGTGTILGLPIQIYSPAYTQGHYALEPHGQISASFGMMTSPIVTSDGLLFQGIAGKAETSSDNASVWYSLSKQGSLSRYDGPPNDGQPHWAVQGEDGSSWWVETTPDATNPKNVQVSMGALPASKSGEPARNLNSPVEAFGVSGSNLFWMEPPSGRTMAQLVVVQVQ